MYPPVPAVFIGSTAKLQCKWHRLVPSLTRQLDPGEVGGALQDVITLAEVPRTILTTESKASNPEVPMSEVVEQSSSLPRGQLDGVLP